MTGGLLRYACAPITLKLHRFEKPTMSLSRFHSLAGYAVRGGLSGLLLLAVPFLLGADDDYLREIESEAKRQATMLISSPLPSTPAMTPGLPEASADRLETGLTPEAFEQALRRSLPGTYTLYQQLDASRKQEVYRAYQNNSQFVNISGRTAQLLSGKP